MVLNRRGFLEVKYSITESRLMLDAKSIIKLWKENLGAYERYETNMILNRYFCYYCENPFHKDKIWLLKTESNENVGGLAVSSRLFKINDKELLFGLEGNFFVDRMHRTLGPSLMLQRMVCEQVGKDIDAAYAFPPKNAMASFKKSGFIEIGEKIRMAKILRSTVWLRKRVRYKFLVVSLSLFIDFVLKIISKETWRKLPQKLYVKQIEKFDESFDSLWNAVSRKYPIISKRTASIMDWRYKNSSYCSYKISGIFNKDDKTLLGYIIYYIDEDIKKRHIIIMDCLFDPDQKVFGFLLSEFIKRLRKEKMCSISFEFFGSNAVKKNFANYGFRNRAEHGSIMIYCGENKQLLSELKKSENWFLTAGDNNGVL